ncbi:hypothetical protein Pmani_034134 [Petrolisthes manimaculis]|uniref:Uncharacterized protein n=1 Tax=Petrolisthes manimaculis TaxID=1843537 RepID=A0AAE1NQM0_9EUCA|nr:hypothetical protein Pmani_034134 [Petrolisthes manimaculis]
MPRPLYTHPPLALIFGITVSRLMPACLPACPCLVSPPGIYVYSTTTFPTLHHLSFTPPPLLLHSITSSSLHPHLSFTPPPPFLHSITSPSFHHHFSYTPSLLLYSTITTTSIISPSLLHYLSFAPLLLFTFFATFNLFSFLPIYRSLSSSTPHHHPLISPLPPPYIYLSHSLFTSPSHFYLTLSSHLPLHLTHLAPIPFTST